MDRCSSFDAYRMSDALWTRFKTLLPKYKVSQLGGRPRRNLRLISDAIFYRLKTGCQWKAIPPTLAPGSSAHAYFQEWVGLGVFDDFWQLALREYHDPVGFDWLWQSVDGAMTKAPLGQENTGPNLLIATRNRAKIAKWLSGFRPATLARFWNQYYLQTKELRQFLTCG